MVVRPRLSRGWEYDFYPDRLAKESEPATLVLCDGFGMRCISASRSAATSNSETISACLDARHTSGKSTARRKGLAKTYVTRRKAKGS